MVTSKARAVEPTLNYTFRSSPLMIASFYGNLGTVMTLLELGANSVKEQVVAAKYTPLMYALEKGHLGKSSEGNNI